VVKQPFARDDGVVRGFRRIVQSETTVRKHMGRTLWWFANRTQVTIQGVRGMMDHGRVVNQPFTRDDSVVRGFRRIVQSETTVRKHMGRTLWSFANRDGGDDGEFQIRHFTGSDYITF
jgi:hypothetical protein